MKCIVLVSGTLPDFRWLKWDQNITSEPKINGTMQANGSHKLIDPVHYKTIKDGEYHGVQVEIYNVSENDFGLYTCFVSNHIGYDYNSAFLIKYDSPRPTTSGKPLGREGFLYGLLMYIQALTQLELRYFRLAKTD